MSNPTSHLALDKRRGASNFRLISAALVLGIVAWFAWPLLTVEMGSPTEGRAAASNHFHATETPFVFESTATANPAPTQTPLPTPDLAAQILANASTQFLLSMSEQGRQHLFLFDSTSLELQRITNGENHDETPALHPLGLSIAYASNANGQWDLYSLDLLDGATAQLTHGSAYESNPTWSGDGTWLAYESYKNDNLDIYMRPIDGSLEPVRLSTDPAVDHSPAWSPSANRIAFVSERGGFNQVWLLFLDKEGDDRLLVVSQGQSPEQRDPAWSPDGRHLAWSAFVDGFWRVFALDVQAENALPFEVGLGEQPAWAPDGERLAAIANGVSESFLLAYNLNGQLVFPATSLPGNVQGLVWGAAFADEIPEPLQAAGESQRGEWGGQAEKSKLELVVVQEVVTDYPKLVAPAKQSFAAMRERLSQILGWDVLSHLESLYLPLSIPPDPLLSHDWSYTGRSLRLLESLAWTEWMQIAKESLNGQDYWRVYLRPVDGRSAWGKPLSATSNLLGLGSAQSSASAYWIDVTSLFQDFGWQRLAATSNWEQYFPGMRFTQFVFGPENSWQAAMLQIHSASKFKEFLGP